MIDLDMLRLQAVKTGLGVKYLAKEERVSLLLKELHMNFLDEPIVLKGGTAFNRGYLYSTKKARFSEDIDIDYQNNATQNEKIQHIKKNMTKIHLFTVSPPRLMHKTLRFDCQYTNQLNEKDRVQVEFYLSRTKSVAPSQKIVLQSPYLPVEATHFPVYCLEELIAQKLVSFYRRTEGKDIYDLYYGLDLPFDKKMFDAALSFLFIHYHINVEHIEFFEKLREKLEDIESQSTYIGNSTNHFIPKDLRPDWTVFIRDLNEKIIQRFIVKHDTKGRKLS